MPTLNRIKKKPRNYNTQARQLRSKYYSSAMWRSMRLSQLSDQPLCQICLMDNIITPADQVHHVTSPFSKDDPNEIGQLFYDFSNLISICASCHGKQHAKEQGVNTG